MNNFGRTVLALGLGTVMTFTNPECFFAGRVRADDGLCGRESRRTGQEADGAE